MEPKPMRVTEEISRLQNRCMVLENRVAELECLVSLTEHLQETVDQLLVVFECGKHPAPVFLRWKMTEEEECSVARATFGSYRLEVIDGKSAVSWSIQKGSKWVAAGGGHTSFDHGMTEVETALTKLIQNNVVSQ